MSWHSEPGVQVCNDAGHSIRSTTNWRMLWFHMVIASHFAKDFCLHCKKLLVQRSCSSKLTENRFSNQTSKDVRPNKNTINRTYSTLMYLKKSYHWTYCAWYCLTWQIWKTNQSHLSYNLAPGLNGWGPSFETCSQDRGLGGLRGWLRWRCALLFCFFW